MSVTVAFCCNDDRGNFADRVESIDIVDEMRLIGPRVGAKAVRMFVGADYVKVGRRKFECGRWQDWFGNIYWQATTMWTDEACRLVRYLLATGWAVEEHAEGGPFAHLVKP